MPLDKIVLIDDHLDTLKLLKFNFEKERFDVDIFQKGKEAMAYLDNNTPVAIVCDWLLDDIDGLDICRYVRKKERLESIPFIMVSGKGQEIDIVTALEVGADDYMVKPVKIKELIVRVKKALGKRKFLEREELSDVHIKSSDTGKFFFKNIIVDSEKYLAFDNREKVDLTISEFKLLSLLMNHPGRVHSRNQIIRSIYGSESHASERSVDVLITSLRKKITSLKNDLTSIRGVGYKLS
ncbi:response regulator transcription factor [Mongoliibacter ruber]|uniref:Two-component system phosphate regulon response regulator PhoB n=1 Tax=Mongoliibacter ruber TaxID=1750599 RepID=A0A2T0WFK7_9BACT|nr:response regulator transcription factor [Mongoliibacter ruber]PRY85456.1 two-component system phosphate regulon response regulator PhoB [Mongoliibacter ruber]